MGRQMTTKYVTEIKYGSIWCPITIWYDFSNVKAIIDILPAWAKRRRVDFNNVRVKRLRNKNELLEAGNHILWTNAILLDKSKGIL